MKNTTSLLSRIGTLAGLFVGALAVSAFAATTWTAPVSTPPTGNVDQPINVGSAGQSKLGNLDIVASGLQYGLLVENGFVGIGTVAPTSKLEVVGGAIKATGGLIIETRGADPATPAVGQLWLLN